MRSHRGRLSSANEQTDEVLGEFGFSTSEIAELRQAKLV